MSLLSTVARWVPDSLGRYVPWLMRARPTLPRDETLAMRPVRNPSVRWERKAAPDDAAEDATEAGAEVDSNEVEPDADGAAGNTGPVVLTVPRRDDGVVQVLARLFQVPATRTIELDEFGSEVWELCDGQHTVAQLVKHTCAKYKLNPRQGEISVTAFMRMLAQRRLVGFITGGKGSSHVSTDARPPAGKRRPGGARKRRH